MTLARVPCAFALILTVAMTASANAQGMPGGGGPGMPMGPMGPTEVGVVTLETTAVPITMELPGRALASKTAEVRPQVGGLIKSVDFTAGATVSAGDVLFEIDAATYEATLAVAEAGVARAEATLTQARSTVKRYEALVGNGVTQADLDDARIAVLQAEADLASANATRQSAQLNVDLTKITAPIGGLVGLPAYTEGSLVTAAQATSLATIRQLDPIYVDLADTSNNLLKIRKQLDSGAMSGDAPSVQLTFDDGTVYAQTGEISVGEVVVSETTSSVTIRASFPNPDATILPGMFVRATVTVGTDPDGLLVPQRAVTFNSSGDATALFAVDGKAVTKILTTDGAVGNQWRVTAGAEPGDQLIVDGLQKISEGSEVTPIPVTIDADGVILQTIAAPGAGQ